MIGRAVMVWVLLLMVAVLNGALREGWITPRWGPGTGHVVSTLLLAALILLVACLTVGWLPLSTRGQALRVGLIWLLLTLAFEFLAGHYLFGRDWRNLWSEYNLRQGRIWVFIPVVTFFAPLLGGYLRGLFR
jgi:hypothetical protein